MLLGRLHAASPSQRDVFDNGASFVNRTPTGAAVSQAIADHPERLSFLKRSGAASMIFACSSRCFVNWVQSKSRDTLARREMWRASRRFTCAAIRSAASECAKSAIAASSRNSCTASDNIHALHCNSPLDQERGAGRAKRTLRLDLQLVPAKTL